MPQVSIIIPLYNKGGYISKTLESIAHQSYQNYEVIIVNDGSTDDGVEIVQQYAKNDGRIRIIHIPNSGVSKARNIGLKHAEGRWIQFLDGDDLIDAGYLTEAVALADSCEVDIFFSNFQMIDKDQNFIRSVSGEYKGIADSRTLCQLFIQLQYVNGFFGFIANKLIRRSLLKESNAEFPADIRLSEDLDFYAKLYPYVKKAYFASINSFYYRQTDENYMNDNNIDYFSQLKVQLDVKRWFVNSRYYEEYRKVIDQRICSYVYFTLFYSFEKGTSTEKYFDSIVNNREIMESICPKYYKGLIRWVLKAVEDGTYRNVFILLSGRERLRKIYRRFMKNG